MLRVTDRTRFTKLREVPTELPNHTWHNISTPWSQMLHRQFNETITLANGLPEPPNILINCPKDTQRLARFRHAMEKADLSFHIVSCVQGSQENIDAAVRAGMLPPIANEASRGSTPAAKNR